MDALSFVLGKTFQLAYSISSSNYLLSIIVFTGITKVILFPVGMWTQYNGIKMIKMRPELNEIKAKYYGDKNAISDETLLLYKREKYNTFVGIVPLFIQVIILMGIIEVVKNPSAAGLTNSSMVVRNICFYKTPSVLGGLYWVMPILAGTSALVLSLFQNKMNLLQAEQSKIGQFGTMVLSIGISLFLGAFVPVAIGTYWIVSNLMTIAQQAILNVILNPPKYIDYQRLEESRKKLNEIKSIGIDNGGGRNKDYVKREKEDYKRFFQVINKKIVFYSERDGYFKYFQKLIEYLLENSSLSIHYITSDPNDGIFGYAKKNERIKPYFIQENKLITLFMKMDADMVIMTMADLEKHHYKKSYVKKDIEYVYIPHYPLSTHMIFNQGAFDNYDTVFCVGNHQLDELRAAERLYNLPEKNLLVTGYGQLELLLEQYNLYKEKKSNKVKILIAPSWQVDNILDSCIDAILAELLKGPYDIYIRPHPEYVKRYKERMDTIINNYKSYVGGNLFFELDFTDSSSLHNSDIVISDWSGAAYEFAFVTGNPVIFINTPMKVNNEKYQELHVVPLEVSLRDKVGVQIEIGDIIQLKQKIWHLLENISIYKASNMVLRNDLFGNVKDSGKISGEYIIDSLRRKIKKRNEKE